MEGKKSSDIPNMTSPAREILHAIQCESIVISNAITFSYALALVLAISAIYL